MSSSIICIKGSDLVEGTNNSVYRYNLNAPITLRSDDKVSLAQLSMYKSWVNISASMYNNHTFSYLWPRKTSSSNNTTIWDSYTITFADGYYSVSDLNEALIAYMTSKGHYITNNTTKVTYYYLEILENPTAYAIQLKCSVLPTNETGFTVGFGNNAWLLPNSATCPRFVIPNNGFATLLGFVPGTYPPSTSSTSYAINSNNGVPNMDPVLSVIVCCNLIYNNFTTPSNVLYSFPQGLGGTKYGFQYTVLPYYPLYNKVRQGTYQYIEISFLTEDYKPLVMKDPDILVLLSIITD